MRFCQSYPEIGPRLRAATRGDAARDFFTRLSLLSLSLTDHTDALIQHRKVYRRVARRSLQDASFRSPRPSNNDARRSGLTKDKIICTRIIHQPSTIMQDACFQCAITSGVGAPGATFGETFPGKQQQLPVP